jgi:lipopolysaccharide export system protein LptA
VNASGNVVSQFVDKPKKDKDGKPIPAAQQQSVFTMVRAPEMTYTDEDRLAYYRGGVVLNRPNMSVKAREIKAYLKDSDDNSDSSLDHAFATGQVVIVQSAPDRTRTGTGEHAEYYIADDKVILEGGQPKMVDSLKGTTMGKQLTYFSKNDRLLVNGVEQQHSESVIRRK